ncbi:hypothetical protein CC80DRAFT_548753 [Byssothecium circinans]|uniref:Uncharacterized protein n=1 Tax=Byssothecium circinans TaxID=147558 RepID=A0A6A5TVJ8_9PLEO|nr:hypothetical protein CC80DRAFT_548753 [Byssothecium circinans]
MGESSHRRPGADSPSTPIYSSIPTNNVVASPSSATVCAEPHRKGSSSHKHKRASKSTWQPGGIVPELAYLNEATPPSSQSSGSTLDIRVPMVIRMKETTPRVDIRNEEVFVPPPELDRLARVGTNESPERAKGSGFVRETMRKRTPFENGKVGEKVLKSCLEKRKSAEEPEATLESDKENEEDVFFDAQEGREDDCEFKMPAVWPSTSSSPLNVPRFRVKVRSSPFPSASMMDDYLRGISVSHLMKDGTKALATQQLVVMKVRTPTPKPRLESVQEEMWPEHDELAEDRPLPPSSPIGNSWRKAQDQSRVSVDTFYAESFYRPTGAPAPKTQARHQPYVESADESPSILNAAPAPVSQVTEYPILREEDVNEEMVAHWKSNPYASVLAPPASSYPNDHQYGEDHDLSYPTSPSPAYDLGVFPRPMSYIPNPAPLSRPQRPLQTRFSNLRNYDSSSSISSSTMMTVPPSPNMGVYLANEQKLRTGKGREYLLGGFANEKRERQSKHGLEMETTLGKNPRVGGWEEDEDERIAKEKIHQYTERGRELLGRWEICVGVDGNFDPTFPTTYQLNDEVESDEDWHKLAGEIGHEIEEYRERKRREKNQTLDNIKKIVPGRVTLEEDRLPTPLSIFYPGIIRGVTPSPSPLLYRMSSLPNSVSSWITVSSPSPSVSHTFPGIRDAGNDNTIDDSASLQFERFDGDHHTPSHLENESHQTDLPKTPNKKTVVWWKQFLCRSSEEEDQALDKRFGEVNDINDAVTTNLHNPLPPTLVTVTAKQPSEENKVTPEMLETKTSEEYSLLSRTLLATYTQIHHFHTTLNIPSPLPKLKQNLKSTRRHLKTTHRYLRKKASPLKTRMKIRTKVLFKRLRPRLQFPRRAESQHSSVEQISIEVGEQLVRCAGRERGMVSVSERAMRLVQRWRGWKRRVRGRVGRLLGRRRKGEGKEKEKERGSDGGVGEGVWR